MEKNGCWGKVKNEGVEEKNVKERKEEVFNYIRNGNALKTYIAGLYTQKTDLQTCSLR